MTKTIFYKKTVSSKGRVKYTPVYEYDQTLLDSFPKGTHLVMVYPGGTSKRYNIDPNYAAMIAAGRVAEDAVCDAIAESQKLKPQKQPITEEQRDLWRKLAASFNRDDYPLIRPAAIDAAEAAVKAMIKEAEKLMTNESVKAAFEQFLLVAELSKKENN